jgi:MarR family transcriptional regulator for hemolysin
MSVQPEKSAHPERWELAFVINDAGRLLRTLADQKAAQFGVTRAKWAVLARLERFEGLKQAELAEMLDLQPITLTRLLDGLAQNGLIERRPCDNDRRAKRLYLTPAARPLLDRLGELGQELMATALEGVDDAAVAALLAGLSAVKENLRDAVQRRSSAEERRYG